MLETELLLKANQYDVAQSQNDSFEGQEEDAQDAQVRETGQEAASQVQEDAQVRETGQEAATQVEKRPMATAYGGRGRPRGSKNKIKPKSSTQADLPQSIANGYRGNLRRKASALSKDI